MRGLRRCLPVLLGLRLRVVLILGCRCRCSPGTPPTAATPSAPRESAQAQTWPGTENGTGQLRRTTWRMKERRSRRWLSSRMEGRPVLRRRTNGYEWGEGGREVSSTVFGRPHAAVRHAQLSVLCCRIDGVRSLSTYRVAVTRSEIAEKPWMGR